MVFFSWILLTSKFEIASVDVVIAIAFNKGDREQKNYINKQTNESNTIMKPPIGFPFEMQSKMF